MCHTKLCVCSQWIYVVSVSSLIDVSRHVFCIHICFLDLKSGGLDMSAPTMAYVRRAWSGTKDKWRGIIIFFVRLGRC